MCNGVVASKKDRRPAHQMTILRVLVGLKGKYLTARSVNGIYYGG